MTSLLLVVRVLVTLVLLVWVLVARVLVCDGTLLLLLSLHGSLLGLLSLEDHLLVILRLWVRALRRRCLNSRAGTLSLTALANGTNASSGLSSVLVLQLAHSALGGHVAARATSILRSGARGIRRHVVGETRLLLDVWILLDRNRGELSAGILGQAIGHILGPARLGIGLGAEVS